MAAATLITLRETLEASLIVGIVLAYLECTQNNHQRIFVWLGVLAGIAMSLVLAIVFNVVLGGFTGSAEVLYEGTTMLIGAGLITWMILWMMKARRGIRKNIENEVQMHLENNHPLGIFLLTLVSTAREGIETVIFLNASIVHAGVSWQIFGGLTGIAVAILFAYMLFRGIKLLSLQRLFTATSVLLILFAAGLVAHGIHEFQEIGLIPIFVEHVWDTNAILNEAGSVGIFFKGLFGYNGNPSLLEALSYGLYLAGIFALHKIFFKRT